MTRQSRQKRRQEFKEMHRRAKARRGKIDYRRLHFQYDLLRQFFRIHLPHRRVTDSLIDELTRRHMIALRQKRIPFLTMASMASFRGRQDRTTPRNILIEMASVPNSPFRLHPYNKGSKTWAFTLLLTGDWQDKVKPLLMKPLTPKGRTAGKWIKERSIHRRISGAKRKLAEQIGAEQAADCMRRMHELIDDGATIDEAADIVNGEITDMADRLHVERLAQTRRTMAKRAAEAGIVGDLLDRLAAVYAKQNLALE